MAFPGSFLTDVALGPYAFQAGGDGCNRAAIAGNCSSGV